MSAIRKNDPKRITDEVARLNAEIERLRMIIVYASTWAAGLSGRPDQTAKRDAEFLLKILDGKLP